jgi:hypothetical protein
LRIVPTTLAAIALASILAACAGTDTAEKPDKGPHASLFLSPAGKPFHAEAGQPYPVAPWFKEADANHDGKLTREEFRADFSTFFKTLDANGDGFIDGIEIGDYERNVAPEVLPRLAQIDGGFPGERPSKGPRSLAQAPTKRGQIYDGASEFSLTSTSEPVASADLNFDGKISLEEFLAAADRRFDQLDKDRDGFLTLDTLPQTPEQVAVEGKKRR